MRHLLRLCLLVLLAMLPAQATLAQMATLIADNVSFDGDSRLVASGNVEVFYEGQRVLAEQLIYDSDTDVLEMKGPITLIDSGGQVITATGAELSGDLKDGIIRGARLVIADQMQIAAVEGHRVEGRYSQLYKAVASSCRVCEHNPTPLWRIRAEKIVHDQEERQLYFTNARFEVLGLPIMWAPRFRLPDPSRRRASGFLVPSLSQNSRLGFGMRVPYFLTLGDHADVTLTPYLARNTRTVEGRYRHALRWGDIELTGAVSVDDILPGDVRAYLFGRGTFALPADFRLDVNVEAVSDRAYLETYGYSDKDRLSNGFEISRARRHEYIRASFEALRTLRDSEVPIEDTLATRLARGTYERRLPHILGGEGKLLFDVQGYERRAESVDADLQDACDAASVAASDCIARDVVRVTSELGWHRSWILGNGMTTRVQGNLAGDYYIIGEDTAFGDKVGRVTPAASVDLRWPLSREGSAGGRSILQPVMQIAWAESYGDEAPNEDSRLVEFDEGNLLALSRFPGLDARETGLRGTVGLAFSHFAPSGREYALALARTYRATDPDLFSGASGLDGSQSDWLVAGRMEFTDTLSLTNRSLFDDTLEVAKSETRLTFGGERLTAATSYIWVEAASLEGRDENVSEWNVDMAYAFGRHWIGRSNWRYDLIEGSAARAGVGLGYRNECVNIDLSLSRRFTSSTNVAPSTDVGLSVSLNGFGQDGRRYARGCAHTEG